MKFQLCAWIAKMKCLRKEGTKMSKRIDEMSEKELDREIKKVERCFIKY